MSITQRSSGRVPVATLFTGVSVWAAAATLLLCLLAGGCGGGGGAKGPPAQPAADAGPAAQQPAPGMPVMVREKAQVGVGAKGHDYKPGLISTPVAEYFKTKEKVAFEIKIPYAMKIHKGLYGSAPASQEEFMDKIIEFNQIKLPELPPGHTYVYDPETEQLYVEHPEGAAGNG
ncbi:MAG: hypothetical protein KDA63_19850 [Planctomycetales bacterium]|nr:hypothetical protein [Planctomycetales bacterium]